MSTLPYPPATNSRLRSNWALQFEVPVESVSSVASKIVFDASGVKVWQGTAVIAFAPNVARKINYYVTID